MAMQPAMAMVPMQNQRRIPRRPKHPFHIQHRPWWITPFMLAPVLPGETMDNLLLQSRCVTDPLKNPLVGWWIEHYFFYVKHRDMANSATFQAMMLDPGADVSAAHYTGDIEAFYFKGTANNAGIAWYRECFTQVVKEFFRNESEAWDDHVVDGYALASIAQDNWMDSLSTESLLGADDIDFTAVGSQDGTAVTASEVEIGMRHWHYLRQANMTDMSYEDYLMSYGVRQPETELSIPELLRYTREWQYPSNTIDPTDGTPRSAVSWSIAERADKARYFSEPGFIFGVTVARPKIYFANQVETASKFLDNAFSWLPAMLTNDPRTSLQSIAATSDVIDNQAAEVWVDLRDLYLYGEQYTNYDLSTLDDGSTLALPTTAAQSRYAPDLAALRSVFVDDTDVSGLTKVRQDGIVSLNIRGRQMDMTPTAPA